jgi:hypothetical protein
MEGTAVTRRLLLLTPGYKASRISQTVIFALKMETAVMLSNFQHSTLLVSERLSFMFNYLRYSMGQNSGC